MPALSGTGVPIEPPMDSRSADGAHQQSPHFARALADLGDRKAVVARTAIHNQQGLKVIDKGVAVNARLYEMLTRHRLSQPLAESVSMEDMVTPATVRDQARELAAAEPLFGALVATPRAGEAVLDELALIPLPDAVALQLTTMREMQSDLWQHSLRCALLAGWLGQRRGGTRYDTRMLCAAGLLHDLGMLHLDPALLRPETVFSAELRRQLHSHPLLTVMLLERHHEYPRELLQAVLDHHEAADGSGYPRRAGSTAISPWGRVLALTEVVTALAAPQRGASAARLSLTLRMNPMRFDPALVAELLPLLRTLGDAPPEAAGDALARLAAIDELLCAWPVGVPAGPQQQALQAQCAGLQRTLADAGIATAQLVMLESSDADEGGQAELALIADEAAWQLKALARRARQLWPEPDAAQKPSGLEAWLERVAQLPG